MKNLTTDQKEGRHPIFTIIIFFLGMATAVIHLIQPDPILKLNGLGYLVLIVGSTLTIKSLDEFNQAAPNMLIFYALTTIGMYFILNGVAALDNQLGMMTKAIEALLVLTMVVSRQAEKRQKARSLFTPQQAHPSLTERTAWRF